MAGIGFECNKNLLAGPRGQPRRALTVRPIRWEVVALSVERVISRAGFMLLASRPMTIGLTGPEFASSEFAAASAVDAALVGVPADPEPPAHLPTSATLGQQIWSLARYMAQTEVHTYAFSVAA